LAVVDLVAAAEVLTVDFVAVSGGRRPGAEVEVELLLLTSEADTS
jgi:hypothetical protein